MGRTTTAVSKNRNGQYQTTIPKAIAEGMDLEKADLEWEIESGQSLKVTVAD